MKKLLVLCFTFIALTATAQDTTLTVKDRVENPTFFMQMQYQRTYNTPEFDHNLSTLDGSYPWVWLSVGRKWGYFLFLSREDARKNKEFGTATGISTGPYFSFGDKIYNEIGIGPGIEFPDQKPDPVVPYAWGYYYFETKPDFRLAKNKIIFQVQYAYAQEWGHWGMGSFTWTPGQKIFGIGLWYQTETSMGGLVKINIPFGKKAVLDFWAGGGMDEKLTFGADFILQTGGKMKAKKKK